MIALNAAVAHQLVEFKKDVDAMIAEGSDQQVAILHVLRRYIKECKAIRSTGTVTATSGKPRLPAVVSIAGADLSLIFDNYLKESSVRMFEETGVMTRKELEARNEVKWETYTKKIQIEARVLGNLVMNHIIPVATSYQSTLIDNVYKMRDLFPADKAARLSAKNLEIIEEIAEREIAIKAKVDELVEARKVANRIANERGKSDCLS